MGTEVLRPQDCLIHQRIRVAPAVFHRRKSYTGNGNPSTNRSNHNVTTTTSNNNHHHNSSYRKPVFRQDQRRKSPEPSAPSISKRSSSADDLRSRSHNKNNSNQNNQILMGQVTLLRRGESLDSKVNQNQQSIQLKKNGDDLMVCGTERIGPDPEMVPKQIRISPSANGLRSDMYAGSAFSLSPSPSSLPLPSFFSKKQGSKAVDDSATRDLRRLLRLD